MMSRKILALAFFLIGAIACGDITNVTNVVAPPPDAGDGSVQTSPNDASQPLEDGGSEASADSGVDASPTTCGSELKGTSMECQIVSKCSSAQCSVPDSLLYKCRLSVNDNRPPIEGCNAQGEYVDTNGVHYLQWCCSPACLRTAIYDTQCPDAGQQFFTCPDYDGGPKIVPAGCTPSIKRDSLAGYCCAP